MPEELPGSYALATGEKLQTDESNQKAWGKNTFYFHRYEFNNEA